MNKAIKFKDPECITKKLLEMLGNKSPSSYQLELAETLLLGSNFHRRLHFMDALTSREAGCLIFAAKGITIHETAAILNVKPSTVATWHKKIKRKLACRSIAQAVFEGIQYGYLPFNSHMKLSLNLSMQEKPPKVTN